MSNPITKVHSAYGAPMGRKGYGYEASPTTPFELKRIRINNGGYDDGGAYWGVGQPLYWYCAYEIGQACEDEIEISNFIRADNRDHAKSIVRAKYPGARFKR